MSAEAPELLDVLIVGAGLSGIGAAHHLQRSCPAKRYAILEARDAIGGTWDLFRYPGVRSDSDMFTLSYPFRPWTDPKAIVDGWSILDYIRQTAQEAGITQHIRFGHQVKSAAWSGAEACWTLTVEVDGTVRTLRTRFLWLCSGYYSYAAGHRPEFPGEADFEGQLVHPQFWPPGLDHAGKKIVVIGSGATAVTLVPELAKTAAQVTMLQRSPSYVVNLPSVDTLAQSLGTRLPAGLRYRLARWRNLMVNGFYYRMARRRPELVKQRITSMAAADLGSAELAAQHFTPRYAPWDQRVCVAPDGDLFRAIRAGRADVVTDTIERFTPEGIRTTGGQQLAADIVVVATGLKLNVLGDITFTLDGQPLDPGQAVSYKGMMLGDVPNLAATFGYTNASWTLKADLIAGYVCRLLRHMDRQGAAVVVPRRDPSEPTQPFLGLSSGYVQRAAGLLPQQGTHAPWRANQSYVADLMALRWSRLDDGVLRFEKKKNEKQDLRKAA